MNNALVMADEITQLRQTLSEHEREINRLMRQFREAQDSLRAEQAAHALKARELERMRTVADYRGLQLQTRIEGYERRSVPRGEERRK